MTQLPHSNPLSQDFESPPKRIRPACPRCGKKFNAQASVEQHARDKHKPKAAPAKEPQR